ncbi:hypothetical protein LNN38_12455 [Pseudomonas sp. LA21]|uniref:hypothetical protein n=1 Tax=unclassified Pseudomonas TaxID=196821 RepID=UPI001FB85AA2|nr:hypothetical protein [Pseudomonas sp. LA21]MCJ1885659.1 hypothetical protein [Pseudomonas sp. LA21]
MAQPCQLYLKVAISRPNLEAFLHSEADSASCFDDFEQWLDINRRWRGNMTWHELCELGQGTTAQAWVDGWSRHLRSPAWNLYDEATQTWTLAVLEFAESREWVIGALNVLRRIADFKDLPGPDHLLIYEYLFEQGNVVAAVELLPGQSRILPHDPPAGLTVEADRVMGRLLRAMDVSGAYAVQRIADTAADKDTD